MHVRRRQLDVAQRCHPERELVERLVLEAAAPQVERGRVTRPRPELRHAGVREARAPEERPVVTARALRLAEEQQCAALLRCRQGCVVAVQVAIERRVGLGERLHLEGSDRGSGMLEAELARRRARKRGGELRLVRVERQQPPHDRLPDLHELAVVVLRQLVRISEHVHVTALATHLAAVDHREHRLGGQDVGHHREQRARRRHESAPARARRGRAEAGARHLAVPEQVEQAEPAVQQGRRVSRDELAPRAERPRGTAARSAGADRERQTVGGVLRWEMARRAGDVTVAAQDLVEHQRPAEIDERRILSGHRTDRDGTPALQGLPELGVERRRQRLRRRDSVAAGREPEQAEANRADDARHHRASWLTAAGARSRFGAWWC